MGRRSKPTSVSEEGAKPRDLSGEAAREACLRLLERRARSAAELRQRLRRTGFEQDIIETVLANLAQAGLVDDAEFARQWVAERIAAGAGGRQKLRWELRRKGIDEDLVRQAVDLTIDDATELEQALDLARRRLRGQPADLPGLLRLKRLLASRGYGYTTVETVIRRLSSEAGGLDDVS